MVTFNRSKWVDVKRKEPYTAGLSFNVNMMLQQTFDPKTLMNLLNVHCLGNVLSFLSAWFVPTGTFDGLSTAVWWPIPLSTFWLQAPFGPKGLRTLVPPPLHSECFSCILSVCLQKNGVCGTQKWNSRKTSSRGYIYTTTFCLIFSHKIISVHTRPQEIQENAVVHMSGQ